MISLNHYLPKEKRRRKEYLFTQLRKKRNVDGRFIEARNESVDKRGSREMARSEKNERKAVGNRSLKEREKPWFRQRVQQKVRVMVRIRLPRDNPRIVLPRMPPRWSTYSTAIKWTFLICYDPNLSHWRGAKIALYLFGWIKSSDREIISLLFRKDIFLLASVNYVR